MVYVDKNQINLYFKAYLQIFNYFFVVNYSVIQELCNFIDFFLKNIYLFMDCTLQTHKVIICKGQHIVLNTKINTINNNKLTVKKKTRYC